MVANVRYRFPRTGRCASWATSMATRPPSPTPRTRIASVVQLGDLVDYGPDSAGVLRIMFDLIDRGAGPVPARQSRSQARALLLGQKVRGNAQLAATRSSWMNRCGTLPGGGRARAALAAKRRPAVRPCRLPYRYAAWVRRRRWRSAAPWASGAGAVRRADRPYPAGRLSRSAACAGWTAFPPGMTVYVGHDRRSQDGRPLEQRARSGGRAIFLDTGAGKGGHLSWIDLPAAGRGLALRHAQRRCDVQLHAIRDQEAGQRPCRIACGPAGDGRPPDARATPSSVICVDDGPGQGPRPASPREWSACPVTVKWPSPQRSPLVAREVDRRESAHGRNTAWRAQRRRAAEGHVHRVILHQSHRC